MPRNVSYGRVDRRMDEMVAAGWVENAPSLIARRDDVSMPSLSSHGYREMMAVARGTMSLDEAAQKTKWAIHAYVRRQTSWLKQQPEYRRVATGPDAVSDAASFVESHLHAG